MLLGAGSIGSCLVENGIPDILPNKGHTFLNTPLTTFKDLAESVIAEKETVAFTVIDLAHAAVPGWNDTDMLTLPGPATKTSSVQQIQKTQGGYTFSGSWQHQSRPLNTSGEIHITGNGYNLLLTGNIKNGTGTILMIGDISGANGAKYKIEMRKSLEATDPLPTVHTKTLVVQERTIVFKKEITRSINPKSPTPRPQLIDGTILATQEGNPTVAVTGSFVHIARGSNGGASYLAGYIKLTSTTGYQAILVPQGDGALSGPILTQKGEQVARLHVRGFTVTIE